MNNTIVVGCDIGGSHISTALVDLQHKSLIKNSFIRQVVDSSQDVEPIIATWGDCIKASLNTSTLSSIAVGIAIPGPFEYQEGVSLMKNQNKYELLYGVNVKVLLAAYLEIAPEQICFINDAASFLEGEMFAGAGKTFKRAVGLTLGTGLGSALYLNGHAVDGDLWCAAFRDGIAEDYLSGRWLKNTYSNRRGHAIDHVKALADLVPTDTLATAVFDEFGRNLAHFIMEHLLAGEPEAVILGGNIAKADALFLESTYKTLAEHGYTIAIKRAELGEMAAIYGAARALK